MYLSSLILILILVLVLFLVLFYNKTNKYNMYLFSFIFSIFIFLFYILKLAYFNKNFIKTMQNFYYEELNHFSFGTFATAFDGMSMLFLCLISFMIPTCMLYMKDYILDKNFNFYLICIFLIQYFLLNAFLTLDIFFFFIYFEASVIPLFLMVVFWGSSSSKIKASFYLIMYTTMSSFFFILSLIILWSNVGSLSMILLKNYNLDFNIQILLWFFFFMTFAVKVPMFPFHIWLPEAHVEAPTVGSVILASLILKLGTYGIMRIMIPILPYSMKFFSPLVNSLCFMGVLYGSFIAMSQVDIKKIMAYSSVVHMNFLVIGIFSFNYMAYIGSIFMMFAHGMTSSALFFLAGMLYDSFKSSMVFYYSGLVFIMPMYSFFFFFFFFSNLGFPGSSNFMGEIMILLGLMNYSFFLFFLLLISFFLSVIYSMWLPNSVIFGNISNYGKNFDIDESELSVLMLYFFLNLYLGLFPSEFLSILSSLYMY